MLRWYSERQPTTTEARPGKWTRSGGARATAPVSILCCGVCASPLCRPFSPSSPDGFNNAFHTCTWELTLFESLPLFFSSSSFYYYFLRRRKWTIWFECATNSRYTIRCIPKGGTGMRDSRGRAGLPVFIRWYRRCQKKKILFMEETKTKNTSNDESEGIIMLIHQKLFWHLQQDPKETHITKFTNM